MTVWDCTTDPYIKSGQHDWFFFTLDLDHSAGLSAKVTLPSIGEDGRDSGMPWDPNKSNNEVVVPLGTTMNTTRPTVPGGSASPGTPTPSSSAPASGSPVATPSTSPSTGATAAPSTSVSTSAVGGSLASTGADGMGTTATAGGAAILLGGGVLALANRRRKRGAHE
ncbi:LPXTG cell wall anchor domain-containing protein [Kitasatospora griseola]|uniref:LPXTG cell wall anchor domain-containing protein n=1 Tax=Kitasatospora griseola TaxID=2064 RepID=UPI00381817A0